jgi:hypothetical protein
MSTVTTQDLGQDFPARAAARLLALDAVVTLRDRAAPREADHHA